VDGLNGLGALPDSENEDGPPYLPTGAVTVVLPSSTGVIWAAGEDNCTSLSVKTDVFSRKIVGYNLSETIEAADSLSALKKALKPIRKDTGLTHHSDRGRQYCAKIYIDHLQKYSIDISMTEHDHAAENALAERVNGILKQEFLLDRTMPSFDYARKQVREAIYIYNHERLHMSIGWRTPQSVYDNHYLSTYFRI